MRPLQVRNEKSPEKMPRVSTLYLKLSSRLSLYFLLLIVLPFLIASAAAYFDERLQAVAVAFETALTRISQEKSSIGVRLGELELSLKAVTGSLSYAEASAMTAAPATTTRPAEAAASPHPAPAHAVIPGKILDKFTPVQANSLSAVYLADSSGIRAVCGPDALHASISSPSEQKWFSDAVKNPDKVILVGIVQRFYREGASKAVLCAAKSLQGINSGPDRPAVLLFDFDHSLLAGFLKAASGLKTERLIIDYEGNIIYCRDTGKLATTVEDTLLEAIGASDEGFGQVQYNDVNYYMTYAKYPEYNWIFIDLNPVSNVTGGLLAHSRYLVACFMTVPVLLMAYLVLSLKLIKPINELTSVITDFENVFTGGNASSTLPLLRKGQDKSVLGGASDVESLISKINAIRLSQKEAELNSLQNQINPHFLYNTLESIRGAALYHGIHDIASMSRALSLLFRYSISDRVLVTVKEELRHLENYISIQNFRYENKFELVYSIPPAMMDIKILKLTLQPLIENSIKHGLEMKLGRGTIKIEMMELDNNIKIQVTDNGLGIPPRKIEELNRSLAGGKYQPGILGEHSGAGIGVANVNSRIKLYFGEQYGLRFREATVGVTVEIILPAVKDI
ncbi:MAG: sensor histidine kinase [Acetivibrionales bacterium]